MTVNLRIIHDNSPNEVTIRRVEHKSGSKTSLGVLKDGGEGVFTFWAGNSLECIETQDIKSEDDGNSL